MGFSEKQVRALSRNVPARKVRSRISAGKELSYIEGWYVLAEANRIFGFDGWNRETLETKCILGRETRGSCTALYSARVRITVRTNDETVVRDGHGTGEANGASAGEVHDRALKAAETDATKRALATFGKAFGLALHAGVAGALSKQGRHREGVSPASLRTTAEPTRPSEGPGVVVDVLGSREPSGDGALNTGIIPRIDKSTLYRPEPRRVRDKHHLRFVASQPCLVCSATPSDAHHIRFAQPRAIGRKVGDEFTVPLCRTHHRDLHHSGNEAAWWHDIGRDPIEVAKNLWRKRTNQGSAV